MENKHSKDISRPIHTIPNNTDTMVYFKDIRSYLGEQGEEVMCIGDLYGY